MAGTDNETRKFAVMALLALWAAVSGYSLVPVFADLTGEGFSVELNRLGVFLGWQAIAGLIGLALWGIGRGLPLGSGVRRISAVPLGIALALLLVVIVILVGVWLTYPYS